MTYFNYTADLPDDPDELRTGNYRLPKSVLLPPYLANNPYFVEYTDAIDKVFDSPVESKLEALKSIRDMWVTSKDAEVKILAGEMLDISQWGGPDHSTVVQQVNLLGLKLSTAELVDEVSYRTLAKFAGSYWFDKGKRSTVDFLNFCLGTKLEITPLWTRDYVSFSPYPGDSNEFVYTAGRQSTSSFLPVYQHSKIGGWNTPQVCKVGMKLSIASSPGQTDNATPWFPTTHVQISVPADVKISAATIGRLFYEVCNYNLVLHSVTIPIEASAVENIVAAGGVINNSVGISTLYYPLVYHSRVGGHTDKVGSSLTQASTNAWL